MDRRGLNMTKKQKTWLIIGIVAGVLTFLIALASAAVALMGLQNSENRKLMDRAEVYLAEVLKTEKVEAETVSLHKDGKEYYCRAEVSIKANYFDEYLVYFERSSEDAEWVILRHEAQ